MIFILKKIITFIWRILKWCIKLLIAQIRHIEDLEE